jgi:DNA primase
VRSRYLQQVAERLSGGQARLALQLEEDLRQQVKGQRWHGRSSRWEQPGDAGVRERAEAEILRLYLHCPSERAAIRQELHRRELDDFALQHHRLLWAAISSLEEDNLGLGQLEAISRGSAGGEGLADLDLPRLLGDQLLVEQSELLNRLTPLLEPSEVQRAGLQQPQLQLRGAVALLERQKSLKRCRHLLDAWGSQRLETLERCIARLLENPAPSSEAGASSASNPGLDMEARIEALFAELNRDALQFQKLYYSERKHVEHLDGQRRSRLGEVIERSSADQLPA